jgi:predicted GNAT family acetyltransferase
MTLASKGQSGEAYSKMIGLMTPEVINNPQLNRVFGLGVELMGKTTDDYISSKKTGASSLVDLLIAKQFAPDLPTTPSQPSPKSGNNIQSGGTNPTSNIVVEPENDITAQPAPGPAAPKTDEETIQTAQDIFINTQRQVSEEGTGLALASLNYVDAQELQGKNLKDDFRIVNLPKTASKYLGQGIDKMLVPKSIEGLKQKGLSIRGSMGTINYENDVQDNKTAKELRQRLQSTIDSQFSRLDNSAEVQQLIEHFGGFDKISPPLTNKTTNNLEWRIKDKNGKDKTISLKSVRDKENPGLAEVFIGVINAANQAAILGMPMLRSGESDEMPPGGQDRKAMAAKFLSETR